MNKSMNKSMNKTGAKVVAVAAFAAAALAPALPLSAAPNQAASGAAAFASEFAPFASQPIRVELQPAAVDITKIDPPREAEPEVQPEPKKIAHHSGSGHESVVVASYYGKRFHGRQTANGERFNMNAMTAAHKKLRFGTMVRVTNVANGRAVVVRINDRGPYIRGRTIDLSRAAAKKIGMIQRGHARVRMEVIS